MFKRIIAVVVTTAFLFTQCGLGLASDNLRQKQEERRAGASGALDVVREELSVPSGAMAAGANGRVGSEDPTTEAVEEVVSATPSVEAAAPAIGELRRIAYRLETIHGDLIATEMWDIGRKRELWAEVYGLQLEFGRLIFGRLILERIDGGSKNRQPEKVEEENRNVKGLLNDYIGACEKLRSRASWFRRRQFDGLVRENIDRIKTWQGALFSEGRRISEARHASAAGATTTYSHRRLGMFSGSLMRVFGADGYAAHHDYEEQHAAQQYIYTHFLYSLLSMVATMYATMHKSSPKRNIALFIAHRQNCVKSNVPIQTKGSAQFSAVESAATGQAAGEASETLSIQPTRLNSGEVGVATGSAAGTVNITKLDGLSLVLNIDGPGNVTIKDVLGFTYSIREFLRSWDENIGGRMYLYFAGIQLLEQGNIEGAQQLTNALSQCGTTTKPGTRPIGIARRNHETIEVRIEDLLQEKINRYREKGNFSDIAGLPYKAKIAYNKIRAKNTSAAGQAAGGAAAGGADSETERIRNKIEVLEGAIVQWTGNLESAREAAMHHQASQEGERNRIRKIQARLQTLQLEVRAEQCKILLLENLAKIDKLRTQAQQTISVSVEDATDTEEYQKLRQSPDYNYEGQQELLILIAEEIKVIARGKKALIIGPVDRQRAILAGSLRWLGFVVLPPARTAEEAKPYIKYADLIINNTNQPSDKVLEQIGVPIEARQATLANVLTFSGLDLLEIDDAKEKVLLEIARWV